MIHGSMTTDNGRNPCFYVITWDAEYHVPINIDTHFLYLSEANSNPTAEPTWRKMHDFVREYNLKDLSPDSMLNLTNNLWNDYGLE